MSVRKKSGAQKLFTGLVSPATAAAMEVESRSWMVRCPHCGYERSFWDAGGVRYKAAGKARQYRRCPNCGKGGWQVIYRREGPPDATSVPTPLPAAPGRRWLLWALLLGSLAAIIATFVLVLLLVLTNLMQPVVTAGDGFMGALKAGDYAQAYALCGPDLQKEISGAPGMAALVGDNRPGQWSWSSRSIRNGVGRLDGSFTYIDGKAGTVHLVLNQVGNDWKIVSFQMNPS